MVSFIFTTLYMNNLLHEQFLVFEKFIKMFSDIYLYIAYVYLMAAAMKEIQTELSNYITYRCVEY